MQLYGDYFINHYITHTIHGMIYSPSYYHQNQANVGKYTSPMDGMGKDPY